MIAADFHDHTLGNTGTPQVPSAGSAQIMKQQSLCNEIVSYISGSARHQVPVRPLT
jgi:hypothetical protein